MIRWLYAGSRESPSLLMRALTSPRATDWLAKVNYDLPFGRHLTGHTAFLKNSGINLKECVEPPEYYSTARRVFERQIRYWACRPLPLFPDAVVAPSDSRVAIGSFNTHSQVWIKNKFFDVRELVGRNEVHDTYRQGDFAIFRLTPEKYHYNHTPVDGQVLDTYTVDGRFHSCHPCAVISLASPYSKNRRQVTLINTDVPGGTGVGVVAMIEIVALMIGDVVDTYCERQYDNPQTVRPGMMLKTGCPKSLFRPGSSTVVLLFESDRVRFAPDLIQNSMRTDVNSYYSEHLDRPLVETNIKVRSWIAKSTRLPTCGQTTFQDWNIEKPVRSGIQRPSTRNARAEHAYDE